METEVFKLHILQRQARGLIFKGLNNSRRKEENGGFMYAVVKS
jgi:hypothetical protein